MACVYTRSDEISILVRDDQNIDTDVWFDKRLPKIMSVTASLATYWVNINNMRATFSDSAKSQFYLLHMRHGFGMLISLNPSDVQMWFCEFRQVARPGS